MFRFSLHAVVGIIGWLGLCLGMAQAAEQPNVIVIMADDLGWADLGCTGSTFYETPHLDRLAKQGMRFTQAYSACPVCSPTRAAAMTGKYPARLQLTDYIPGNRKGKLNPATYLKQLPLEEQTIAETLKAVGYRTGFVGKWHLGGEGFGPEQQGFDHNIAGCERGSPPSYFSPYKIPKLTDGPQGEYLTDRLGDEAVAFIESAKEKPFLLWYTPYAPHTPLQAKKDLVAKFQAKAEKLPKSKEIFRPEGPRQDRRVQDHAVYAAMVASVDDTIGKILDKLDQLKLTDRTLILFTSDNGGLSTSEGSPTSNAPLRAGKGWLFEGGIRVPLLVHYPKLIQAGSVCDYPVITTDFYATLLEITKQPLQPDQHNDGVSFLPLLEGKKPADRSTLYWHYPHYGNQGGTPGGAIRHGDWKLIEWFETGRTALFNLKEDPYEQTDLASQQPTKAKELREQMQNWRKSVNAQMPTPNPDFKEKNKP